MEKRYAILDSATRAVINVAAFDIPDGGQLYHSGDGQHWIVDAGGAFHGSFKAEAGHALIAVGEDAFVEPGCVQLEDGSFVRPQP